MTIEGHLGGTLVDSKIVALTNSRQLVSIAFNGIDTLKFVPVDPGGMCNMTPWNVAMDDVTVVIY